MRAAGRSPSGRKQEGATVQARGAKRLFIGGFNSASADGTFGSDTCARLDNDRNTKLTRTGLTAKIRWLVARGQDDVLLTRFAPNSFFVRAGQGLGKPPEEHLDVVTCHR